MARLRELVSACGLPAAILASLVVAPGDAGAGFAEDTKLCFGTADRVTRDEDVSAEEKGAAHEACLRALAASSNVVHKYHLQEADFDIMGTRPKN